jgi:hypothetical protein
MDTENRNCAIDGLVDCLLGFALSFGKTRPGMQPDGVGGK